MEVSSKRSISTIEENQSHKYSPLRSGILYLPSPGPSRWPSLSSASVAKLYSPLTEGEVEEEVYEA